MSEGVREVGREGEREGGKQGEWMRGSEGESFNSSILVVGSGYRVTWVGMATRKHRPMSVDRGRGQLWTPAASLARPRNARKH